MKGWIHSTRALVGLALLTAAVHGQQLTPIADPVSRALLPSGITNFPLVLNGRRAHSFSEPDGTSVVHVVGEFVMSVGEGQRRELRSYEAVVWIARRQHQDQTFQQVDVLLWRDAEIIDIAGTRSSGPALFATISTRGEIRMEIDDWATQAADDTEPYRRGLGLRAALAARQLPGPPSPDLSRVIDLATLAEPAAEAARPLVQIWAEGELNLTETPEHGRVLTVTGGVDLARGVPGQEQFLEIHADSVAIFLAPSKGQPGEPVGGIEPPRGLGAIPVAREAPPGPPGRPRTDRQMLSAAFGEVEVEGAYLEGDVVMAQGPNLVRASRIYYDFRNDRAIILDAVFRTLIEQRNVPLYVRASQIRQLSRTRYAADDAVLTTSEFRTPHYHVGASHVELSNLTPTDPTQTVSGVRTGNFRIRDATLNIGGQPVAYWPYIQGNVDASETALQSLRMGYSDDFGVELESNWELFSLLGYRTPEGYKSTLSLDYFSERGPAAGIDLEYERDRYFGLMRSYLLHDHGTDTLGEDENPPPPPDIRGRFLLRHRQYLEDDWQASLELSYISDENFLQEFFESEFDNGKEQETLLYLKRQRDNWAFTALLQYRILDWLTQTERLPDFALFLVGERLGDRIVWHSENRAGLVRLSVDDDPSLQQFLEGDVEQGSGTVVRGDSRQEFEAPFDLGPWRFVPFASVRGTAWDDSPDEGGLARAFATYGMRGSMYLWRVYPNARSELFDIDGIRHIIKPHFIAWMANSNVNSDDLFQFDQFVEGINDIDGGAFGIRQQLQTHRGEGENRRSLDLFTHDIEVGAFNDAPGNYISNGYTALTRPEESISRNYIGSSLVWRVNDRTGLGSRTNYDLSDGKVDIFDVTLAVERTPRFSYLIAYRLIDDTQSDLIGLDMNYRLTEKHMLAVRELFDLNAGDNQDFTVALIRKFPRWFAAISLAIDEAEDDWGISLSVWPEGVPSATLGSSRFAGMTDIARHSFE